MTANTTLISLQVCDDNRGSLIALEDGHNLPFDVKRVYYIYGTKAGVPRGFHAHKHLKQLLIAVSGSVFVKTEHNGKTETHLLNRPDEGLLIEGLVWREMYDFSRDCVLLVLAGDYYNESDYIRDYGDFLKAEKMIKNTHDFKPIEGKYVNLREAEVEDAAFILSLRTDPKKARFIHKTDANLQKQIEYMKHYKTLDDEWYFIIENKQHEPLGTTRIYGVCGTQYTGGSWLMKNGALPEETLEGALLARQMAFENIGFEKDCFDVRKDNKKVVRFHKLCGAQIVAENDVDYFFEITRDCYNEHKKLFWNAL